jgi:hypothetical protein
VAFVDWDEEEPGAKGSGWSGMRKGAGAEWPLWIGMRRNLELRGLGGMW